MIQTTIGMMIEKPAITLLLAQLTQSQDLLEKILNVFAIQIITGTREKEFVTLFHLVDHMQLSPSLAMSGNVLATVTVTNLEKIANPTQYAHLIQNSTQGHRNVNA